MEKIKAIAEKAFTQLMDSATFERRADAIKDILHIDMINECLLRIAQDSFGENSTNSTSNSKTAQDVPKKRELVRCKMTVNLHSKIVK
mmetsp:Transcript_9860/g.11072  ORF Transcript_9860/g.11072 Transcript_9860/m.11072 type:complete len:88 (+) Transcript_9860:228-491(+)